MYQQIYTALGGLVWSSRRNPRCGWTMAGPRDSPFSLPGPFEWNWISRFPRESAVGGLTLPGLRMLEAFHRANANMPKRETPPTDEEIRRHIQELKRRPVAAETTPKLFHCDPDQPLHLLPKTHKSDPIGPASCRNVGLGSERDSFLQEVNSLVLRFGMIDLENCNSGSANRCARSKSRIVPNKMFAPGVRARVKKAREFCRFWVDA